MFSPKLLADEGLRSTKVGVADTRVISTVSAEEILRSAQRGGETMLDLVRLGLGARRLSMSLILGAGDEKPRLLVSVV